MNHPEVSRNTEAIYGIHAVKEAVTARAVDYVLVTQGQHNPRVQEVIDACRTAGVTVRFAPAAALERQAGTEHHQHVVAVCAARTYNALEDLLAGGQPPLLMALDGVEDPANLGAILRTVAGAGGSGVIIPERRAAGLTPAVARTAAGALEHVRVARVPNLVRSLVELKKHPVWIYGFDAAASRSYLELDYTAPCALVFGGEGRGLHRLVREACDETAKIPLHGPVGSLNVSVAAGIVLYEALRQREQAAKRKRD